MGNPARFFFHLVPMETLGLVQKLPWPVYALLGW